MTMPALAERSHSFPGISPVDMARLTMQPSFELGRCVATPGAMAALQMNRQSHSNLLMMHEQMLWIHMDDSEIRRNRAAIESGQVVHGEFKLRDGTKLWIITEGDRSVTTLLLPGEY